MIRHTPEFDQRIADWLEADPNLAPPDVMSTVVAALPSISQARRGLLAPRRFTLMPTYLRLAAVAVVVAVVGVCALTYFGSDPGGGATAPPPTASPAPTTVPTPRPTESLAAGPITSPLYGYTVTRPEGWRFTPSSVAWSGVREDPYFDTFAAPVSQGDEYGDVHIAALPVPDGMTTEDWLLAYAESQEASSRDCKGPADDWTDGSVGSLAIRRLDLRCTGEGYDLRLLDVAFVIEGTGYVMSGNPTVIGQFLEEFQPGP
jgi:hypothetical protein